MITRYFTDFWSALAPRERAMIIGGSAIIVVTAVFMLYSSVLSERSSLKREIATIEQENEWMIDQAELLSRLSNSCMQNRISAVSPNEFITRQAQRNSITVSNMRASAQGSIVNAAAADGNAFLRFSHQLLCQGYGIKSLSVEKTEDGSFQARLEVSHGS